MQSLNAIIQVTLSDGVLLHIRFNDLKRYLDHYLNII